MKGFTAIFLLFVLGSVATAKPAPVEQAQVGIAMSDVDINIGASGPTREREYFQSPQAQFNAGGFVCRVSLIVFDKTRLASSCR
jgi:hypothetical protein